VRDAQNLLQKAMLHQPDFSAALGALCRSYMREFARTEDPLHFMRADSAGRVALQEDADSPHTRLALATLHNNAGDPDTARDIALDLVKRLPHFEPAYNQLGQAYWQLGELDQAEQTFVTAAAIHEQNWG